MAHETGTATGIEDLITKLFLFAGTTITTKPWTVEELDLSNNWGTLSIANADPDRDDVYVSFRWPTSTIEQLGVYQSLGFSGPGIAPHLHTSDSGNGSTVGAITTERRVNFESSGPFTSYDFFAGEGDTPYIYVVVEVDAGRYRHFGFGNLNKLNDFQGGEFAYAHVWSQNTNYIDIPHNTNHNVCFDHGFTAANGATIHLEGLPNQDGASEWGVAAGNSTIGNDTAANSRIRVQGGLRGGMMGYYITFIPVSTVNAYKALVPIELIYFDETDSVDAWRPLGNLPDIAIINMKNLVVDSAISDGTNDWRVFPMVRKQYLTNNTEESWNAGIAYKVT
jgi:hypothetical protein